MALLSFSCLCLPHSVQGQCVENNYLRWVDDIAHDAKLDGKKSHLCNDENSSIQYFNPTLGLQYEGEKTAIENTFYKKYKPVKVLESGWIRVRFIVNCKGEAGRFRVIESDENYTPRPFSPIITTQILKITKSLKGWKPLQYQDRPADYYQYVIVKIKNGNIEKILP
ncbi:MAG: hypothetical protein EAZ57_07130 [Cytophagales bacterium]|nr:MAG: hypothetical protein EAZ67_07940 [Cytophagales bacterium]TAF60474.1 MAG: hypothetical protein EAZ57_07130 [Cytophagales bacterium]